MSPRVLVRTMKDCPPEDLCTLQGAERKTMSPISVQSMVDTAVTDMTARQTNHKTTEGMRTASWILVIYISDVATGRRIRQKARRLHRIKGREEILMDVKGLREISSLTRDRGYEQNSVCLIV